MRLEEALDFVLSPYALERFSALTGQAALVVDLDSQTGAPPSDVAIRFRQALAQLPCPSVAICAEQNPASEALADRFDVLVAEASESETILAAIAAAPLACQALVQLLRLGDRLAGHDALVAESLAYSTLQSGPEFAAWRTARPRPDPPPDESGPAVRVERFQDELVLSLNRPLRHNAFSVEMRDGLVEGLQMAVADERLSRIVLRAEGPSFSSGGDLSEFGDFPDPSTAHAVRSTRNPGRLLLRCAARTEARVHGACIGAGAELPAFAARVVAAEGTFFQLPEVSMGLVPGAGGTTSLPRRIGRQRVARMALSGERIEVGTALRWGLVDEIAR
jgi:enoyl-CoA hydratase